MSASLDDKGRASRARAEQAMRARPLFELETLIETLPRVRPFGARLSRQAGPHPRIIAGVERPVGPADAGQVPYRPRQIAMGYARVGAAALSVATEPDESGGDIDHISEVRPAHLPILRNDYLVTPYQIAQSRVAGADAVLLIARLLAGAALGIMVQAAQRYGVEALVEARDEEDLARAVEAGASLLSVDLRGDALLRSPERLPPRTIKVAHGGFDGRSDADRLCSAGFDALLVDGPRVHAADPADALWALLQPAS